MMRKKFLITFNDDALRDIEKIGGNIDETYVRDFVQSKSAEILSIEYIEGSSFFHMFYDEVKKITVGVDNDCKGTVMVSYVYKGKCPA